ncbi:MAG: DUF86 domain-containing protein [Candidatus Methylacidiphilales bacterium]
MTPRTQKYLHDMAEACHRILAFTADATWEHYQANELLRSAVERQFEILGEAANRLRDAAPDEFASLPEAPAIVGLRNRLAHGYDIIEDAIIWSIVQEKIRPLLECLQSLLPKPTSSDSFMKDLNP